MPTKRLTGKYWKTYVISIVLLISSPILADMGLPDIQAVCRITLKDGKTVDGILLVGKGGYQRYLDTNGFYIIAENPPYGHLKRAVLFNLRFQWIMPFKGKAKQGGSTSTNPTLANNPRVYYLHDITSKNYYTDDTKIKETLKQEKSRQILKRKITHDLIYELLDYIPVYPELPDVIHLKSGYQQKKAITPIGIPVIQIEKFEILRNPPRKWLDDIAEKTRTWDQKYGTCDDCVLLVEWYHELVKKAKSQREYVEGAFKPWIF